MISRADALAAATVYNIEMPLGVYGVTEANRSGTRFIIAINTRACAAMRRFALEHELAHIRLKHHNDSRDLHLLEAEADALAADEIRRATA